MDPEKPMLRVVRAGTMFLHGNMRQDQIGARPVTFFGDLEDLPLWAGMGCFELLLPYILLCNKG